jgi:hypothetical protein
MTPLEKVSLVTGGLAAFAALVNALVSLFNGWRENRWLKIALKPDEFAEGIALGKSFPFDLAIVNSAKASNFIKEWHCYIDSTRQPCSTDPVDLLAKPIEGYQQVGGWVLVPSNRIAAENYKKVTFEFVPVRGRRRKFRFKRTDLLHAF